MHRTAWIALIVFLGLAQTALAQNDRIRFRDPGREDARCDIIDISWKKVDYYLITGGKQFRQNESTKKIREILFGDTSKQFDYRSAENLMNSGQFAAAIPKFEKARSNPRCNRALRQKAGMNILLCHYYAGQYDKAVQSAEQFRRDNPNTYYLAETYQLQYDAYLGKNPPDFSKMERTIQEFSRAADSKNRDWKYSAEIMRAGLYEFRKKWDQALSIYSRSAYQKDLVVGPNAKLGELRCLSALGKWSRLKSRGESILRDGKKQALDETLLMGANIALGDVQLSGGKTKEAIYSYLRAAIQLHKSGEPSREHETALGRASIACSRHAAKLQQPEGTKEYLGISGDLIAELSRTYPASPLLAKAKKERSKVRIPRTEK